MAASTTGYEVVCENDRPSSGYNYYPFELAHDKSPSKPDSDSESYEYAKPQKKQTNVISIEDTMMPSMREIEQPSPMEKLPSCYCGVISRSDSERILKDQLVGTYLLRVSETRSGYTVSLRTTDRCKHFAVEQMLENGKFVVVGEKPKFQNFNDLVRFYKVHPISPHGDLLKTPLKRQVLLDFHNETPVPPTRGGFDDQ